MNQSQIDFLKSQETIYKDCPVCHGADLACSCYAEYAAVLRSVKANIPLRFVSADIEDIIDTQYLAQRNKIIDYAELLVSGREPGASAYFHGGPQTAKTFLACWVMRQYIEAFPTSESPVFTSRDELVDVSINDPAYLESLYSTPLLCIDNVTFYYKTDAEKMAYADYQFGKLLMHRFNNMKSTILTSRITPAAFVSDCEASGIAVSFIASATYNNISFTGEPYKKVHSGRKKAKSTKEPKKVKKA